MPANVHDFGRSKQFAQLSERLLANEKIRPHPVDVRYNGLEGVVSEGLDEMRSGMVSGKKLVYVL